MRRTALEVLALGAAILAVFGIDLKAPLFYDDIALIGQNPLVTGPWPGWGAYFLHSFGAMGEYEPVTTLIHRWLYIGGGGGVVLFHLSNLLLHWSNAVLLLFLYRRLLGDERLAFAAAAAFALYPGHAEVLAVATFKKHLLVSLCALAILLLADRRSPGATLLCWLLQGLALFTKETALVIPCLSAAVGRGRILHAGLFALAGLFVLFRTAVVPRYFPAPLGGSWAAHAATSFKCLLWSLSQLPLPWDLCLEHTLAPASSAGQALWVVPALGALAALLAALIRSDRAAGFGLLWALLALLPFMNLLPFLNFSLVSNRYLYFASAGFFLLAARLSQRAWPGRGALLLCPLILVYGIADVKAMGLFADPYALWTKTVVCAPQNPRAHAGLAIAMAGNRQFEPALEQYREALRLDPNFSIPYFGLAEVYAQTGRLTEAIALAQERARRSPGSGASMDLGLFYLQDKRYGEALSSFQKALDAKPADLGIRLDIALCRLEKGELGAAEEGLLDLVEAAPPELRSSAFKLLGDVLSREGRAALALRAYREALELSPGPEAALAFAKAAPPEQALAALDRELARLMEAVSRAQAAGRERDRAFIAEAQSARRKVEEARSAIARTPARN